MAFSRCQISTQLKYPNVMQINRKNQSKELTDNVLLRSLSILTLSDKKKISLVVGVQVFLGLLDLFAILTVGILGALAVNGIQSRSPGSRAY